MGFLVFKITQLVLAVDPVHTCARAHTHTHARAHTHPPTLLTPSFVLEADLCHQGNSPSGWHEEIMGKDLQEIRNKDILHGSYEFAASVVRARALGSGCLSSHPG